MINSLAIKTPLGWITVEEAGGALVAVDLPAAYGAAAAADSAEATTPTRGVLASARRQLDEYFAGTRSVFDLPLAPVGTPFQRKVWSELSKIPYGETCSYADIAKRIGRATACRAVGSANGRNPIPIIIPCHRVIGASGKLVGYAGGIDTKQWLLRHERAATQPLLPLCG